MIISLIFFFVIENYEEYSNYLYAIYTDVYSSILELIALLNFVRFV